jgi:Zn-dependent M16 (insulinase) family peptidase
MISYSRESIGRAQDTLVKALYLKRISKLLEDDPDQVTKQMEELRDTFCKLENLRILVIADLNRLKTPVSVWKSFSEGKPFVRTVH